MFNLDDYEPVDARIAKWWAKHPEGSLQTELIVYSDTRFIVKATAYTADGLIVATGYAEETISQKGVNANFALPNCETSAIGRCLANAGFQAKLGKRASREEMEKVNRVNSTIDKTDKTPAQENADLWAITTPAPIAEAVSVLERELGAQVVEVPSCKHGLMQAKSGISSKTGKPYSGYVCSSKDRKDQCEPRWNK